MPIRHLCQCGALLDKPGRCRRCEAARNEQPHRKAHRTRQHYTLRDRVFARDHYRCVDCGSTTDLTLDYIIPLQDGGRMNEDNAATRCRTCNARQGRRSFRDTPSYPQPENREKNSEEWGRVVG